MIRLASLAILAAVAGCAMAKEDRWLRVELELDILKHLLNFTEFAVTAGDTSGRKFSYQSGGVKLTEQLLMASASKFPAAVAIAGAVNDGHITFDTKISQVFRWWTTDPADPRSRVTLRQLLSFTSGFYWQDASGDVPCLDGSDAGIVYTPEACAKQIYDQAPFLFEPGTTFAYNSFHLQIAGAVAATASRMTVQQLLRKNLFEKAGMNHSGWLLGQNPYLAAGMHTTGDDYDLFLRKYLSYEIVPKAIADELERDYLIPPYASVVANSSLELTSEFGHYSMANWYECIYNFTQGPNGEFTKACRDEKIHMDLGLFGYYPILDRSRTHYMQIAQADIVCLNCTNPGVDGALPLREFIKPWIDWAINGTGPPPHDALAGSESVLASNTDPATRGTDGEEDDDSNGNSIGDGTAWTAAAHGISEDVLGWLVDTFQRDILPDAVANRPTYPAGPMRGQSK